MLLNSSSLMVKIKASLQMFLALWLMRRMEQDFHRTVLKGEMVRDGGIIMILTLLFLFKLNPKL